MEPSTKSIDDWIQIHARAGYANLTQYLSPRRMASIGYQFNLVSKHFPTASVLEVGVGVGVTTDLLRKVGHEVCTMDVDPELKPTLIASVTDIPVEDGHFDCFLCSQVLEHISWPDAQIALTELRRTSKLGGILSLPTVYTQIGLRIDCLFPGLPTRTLRIGLPFSVNKKMVCPDQHSWEIGVGVSMRQVRNAIKEAGFVIVNQLQPLENPYHQFFVLKAE